METETNGTTEGVGDTASNNDQSPAKDGQLSSPSICSAGDSAAVLNGVSEEGETDDTWEWFNILRTLCDTPKRIGVCLEVSADLVSESM